MAHPYPSERKLLKELLMMYREDTVCLWNPTHPGYTNKVSRRKAIETLLVKFRELDPSADAYMLKKKIENMRTTYKRERLKVLRSRRPGGETLYEPTLWYYPLMRFLDELDPSLADDDGLADPNNEQSYDITEQDNDSEHCAEADSPTYKKTKTSTVYITDEVHDYEQYSPAKVRRMKYSSDDEEPPYLIQNEEPPYLIQNYSGEAPRKECAGSTAGDLFGRAMTTRLNELMPQQRFIAEKLISDVIFLGRLNKLKTGSTINVNDDSY